MSISRLESTGLTQSAAAKLTRSASYEEATLRRAATEFEGLLLKQLTAALNPSEDNEDSLFGDSNGNGMYQQMFSEQLAQAMASSGGVGLAETLIRQVKAVTEARENNAARRAVEVARNIRGVAATDAPTAPAAHPANREADVLAHPAAFPTSPVQMPAHPAAAALATGTTGTAPPRVQGNQTPLPPRSTNAAATNLSASAPPRLNAAATASAAPVAGAAGNVNLQLPVRGRVSSNFGTRRDPLHGGHRQHGGVDIAAPRGTAIAAAAPGKVVFAGRRGGYGNLVEVEHADGRRTRYAHADQILVKPGETVERGQTLATVGSTGRSTGPHLHFEVRNHEGAKVDPLVAVAKDSSSKRR